MSVDHPSVLVVEDEAAQREVLVYNLKSQGYEVFQARDGEEALLSVAEDAPDLVLLDWMLPNVSGIEICRRMKTNAKTRDIPVIMLSARSEELDRIRGLENGADDYVVKPYSVAELMARVRNHLRRIRPAAIGQTLEFQDIVLNGESHQVFRAGQEINLGPTEYRLLVTLLEKPRRVFSREQLLDRVWGRDIYVDSRTVDVHIGRLRKAICINDLPDIIRTVRGAGYALGR